MHNYVIQIFYEDTDAAGIVYHANYIKFMERARTIWLQDKGFSLPSLAKDFSVQFLVRSLSIDFERPARLQQQVNVVTQVAKYGKASMTFEQRVYLDPQEATSMICSGEVVLVCTDLNYKTCTIPDSVLRELKK